MFRLCGIISFHSGKAADQMYTDTDWVVKQIGVGRLKAAEALDAVFGDLKHKLTIWEEHTDSFAHLWSLVVAATQGKKGKEELGGNGDHCQLIAIPCLDDNTSLKNNQDRLYELVKDDLMACKERYWVRIHKIVKGKYYDKDTIESKKMAPTDEVYFMGRFIEMINKICAGNERVTNDVAQCFFPEDELITVILDSERKQIPSFVRAMYAKLYGTLYLSGVMVKLPVTEGLRMSARTLACIAKHQTQVDFPKQIRDGVVSYLMSMDGVTTKHLYQNVLSLEIVKLVDKLLRGGCFSANHERPPDGNVLLGTSPKDKATGPPSAESCTTRALLRLLVNTLSVATDPITSRAAKQLNENARVVREIKATILGSCMYLFQLWQSSRTQTVVEEFMAAENNSSRAVLNPIYVDAASPQEEIKSFAERCEQKLRAYDTSSDLLPGIMQERLINCLLELTTFDDLRLKGAAWQFLFDLKMPSRGLIDMIMECNLITTDDDAIRQQSLRQQLSDFDTQYAIMADVHSLKAERQAANTQCTRMINILMDTCDDPHERPHRETMIDLGWHTRLLQTLNLRNSTKYPALSALCLRCIGVLCTDVKENQTTVAEDGLLSTIVPALLIPGEIQIAAADAVAFILQNNKRVCQLHCHEIATTVVRAAVESREAGRLQFQLVCLELLPVLIKSSYHEIFDACVPKVTKAIARDSELFDMELGGSKHNARKKLILGACAKDAGPEVTQVEIYVSALNTLAILGTGTDVRLCWDLLPLGDVMQRMIELLDLEAQGCENHQELFVRVKRGLCAFFDRVYLSTTTVKQREMLRTTAGAIWLAEGTQQKSVMRLLLVDILHLVDQFESAHKKAVDQRHEFHDTEDVTRICPFLHEYIFGVALRMIANILKAFPKTTLVPQVKEEAENVVEELEGAFARLQMLAADVQNQQDILQTIHICLADWKGGSNANKDIDVPHLHASEAAIVHRYCEHCPPDLICRVHLVYHAHMFTIFTTLFTGISISIRLSMTTQWNLQQCKDGTSSMRSCASDFRCGCLVLN
jgi:hypothetical protein